MAKKLYLVTCRGMHGSPGHGVAFVVAGDPRPPRLRFRKPARTGVGEARCRGRRLPGLRDETLPVNTPLECVKALAAAVAVALLAGCPQFDPCDETTSPVCTQRK
jgi:hypothetical protein